MRYVGAALLLSVSLPAHVQAQAQAQVPELYLDELNEVTMELRDSIALVAPMSSDERRSAVDIQMSLYRSSESLRRIERYTRSQNNDLVRLGNAPNRALLRSAALAVQLDAAQQMLARHYEPLVARDPRHLVALRGWLVVYVFTGIQLAWVLRPFRGTAGFPVEFLRPEAFEQNAYLVVLDHFARLLR